MANSPNNKQSSNNKLIEMEVLDFFNTPKTYKKNGNADSACNISWNLQDCYKNPLGEDFTAACLSKKTTLEIDQMAKKYICNLD